MGRAVVVKKLKRPIMVVPGIKRLEYDDEFHQMVLEQQKKIDEEKREKQAKEDKKDSN
ncbi:hypothetical protein [Alkalicoccus chagannorensis]|uniref:hypothetical protein n=1 Tax=Alkalicoccus chagannorensis TaxID=427072 RepID=UPI00041A08D2|nr:hypothetical protein [Alkalicoccus chagannorensis]